MTKELYCSDSLPIMYLSTFQGFALLSLTLLGSAELSVDHSNIARNFSGMLRIELGAARCELQGGFLRFARIDQFEKLKMVMRLVHYQLIEKITHRI